MQWYTICNDIPCRYFTWECLVATHLPQAEYQYRPCTEGIYTALLRCSDFLKIASYLFFRCSKRPWQINHQQVWDAQTMNLQELFCFARGAWISTDKPGWIRFWWQAVATLSQPIHIPCPAGGCHLCFPFVWRPWGRNLHRDSLPISWLWELSSTIIAPTNWQITYLPGWCL